MPDITRFGYLHTQACKYYTERCGKSDLQVKVFNRINGAVLFFIMSFLKMLKGSFYRLLGIKLVTYTLNGFKVVFAYFFAQFAYMYVYSTVAHNGIVTPYAA